MAIIIISYQENLQFSCFTPDPTAMPEFVTCAGTDAFFSSFSIVDVTLLPLPGQEKFFLFDPGLIFPSASGSPGSSSASFQGIVERTATILIKPPVSVFAGFGGPMLIVRRVNLPGDPRLFSGVPTQLSYAGSGSQVLFAPVGNISSVPRITKADPSNF